MTFSARPDRHLIRPTYRSNRFVLVDITAPESTRTPTRDPLNACFVLDRSGSMAGSKIDLARQAIDASIGSLAEQDRFAVVVYDDRIDTVVETTRATSGVRRKAREALDRIDARGSTNLFEGWMHGCEQVARHQDTSGMHRVLLMSDGLANQGVTDREELARHAEELWRRGVATWTFGVGSDFDELLLERMAAVGGGQSFYIERAAQIRDYVTSAVGEALDTVARDVAIRVIAPEGVVVEAMSLFPSRAQADGALIELGDLVSEQHLRVVLRVNFPFGEVGTKRAIRIELTDRDGAFRGEATELAWEYADHRANDLQPRDSDVDREVARLFASRVRKEAVELNLAGNFRQATERMQAVARRIRGYAGADPVLLSIVAELEQEQVVVAAAMPTLAAKQMLFSSSYQMRFRDATGKPVRRS
jgi:Ca-activated chloride channel family protein